MSIKDLNKEEIIVGAVATLVVALLILLLTNLDLLSFRQVNDYIEDGNDQFGEQKYDDAKVKYVGALNKDSLNSGALYNNANADYRNGRYEMADKTYEKAVRSSLRSNATQEERDLVANMFHNKGNSGMKQLMSMDSVLMMNEMIQQAEAAGQDVSQMKQQFYQQLQNDLNKVQSPIKSYKESLKSNPDNDSTRFNLAMAQDYQARVAQILQNMVPPSSSNQNNKDDKKDDQQNQQQNQQQQQQQQEQQEEQQDENQMSKDNAEQILKALEQQEKEQLKKKKSEKDKSRFKTDKDW